MENRIFHRRASDLGEIDVAFAKTFVLATVGLILFYLALRMNGVSINDFGLGKLFLVGIGIYIVCFLITESQSNHISFYVGEKRVYMDYEMKNGEILNFTDVNLKHWWTYRTPSREQGQRGTSTDLYVLVEDENGEKLLLKDEQTPWKSIPSGWPYNNRPIDESLRLIETSNLKKLISGYLF